MKQYYIYISIYILYISIYTCVCVTPHSVRSTVGTLETEKDMCENTFQHHVRYA